MAVSCILATTGSPIEGRIRPAIGGKRNMKQVFLGAAAAMWAGTALAADFPNQPAVTQPPVAPAPFSWTGGFAGLNAGWGTGKIDSTATIFGGGLNGATPT